MGMRGYDILPFNSIINIFIKNRYLIERNRLDEVVEINENDLLKWIIEYRMDNFGITQENFIGSRMQFSMVFDNPINDLRTLVVIGNEVDESTAKAETKEMIDKLKMITHLKTNGRSSDPCLSANNVTGMFILSTGVSSFSRAFFDEWSRIQIIKDDDILHRCYDNCLQSHVETIDVERKNVILSDVGLNSNSIPSTSKSQDVHSKVMNIEIGSMLKFSRKKLQPEETTDAIFLRNVRP